MTWCTTHRARAWLLARAALAATGLGGLSFACSTDGRTLEPSESLTRIGIVPESTEVQPDQTVQFRAYGVSTRGNTEAVDVRWEEVALPGLGLRQRLGRGLGLRRGGGGVRERHGPRRAGQGDSCDDSNDATSGHTCPFPVSRVRLVPWPWRGRWPRASVDKTRARNLKWPSPGSRPSGEASS